MSEEEKGAAAPAPENSGQPQIMIQRVYLKDLSFESPNSPVFHSRVEARSERRFK